MLKGVWGSYLYFGQLESEIHVCVCYGNLSKEGFYQGAQKVEKVKNEGVWGLVLGFVVLWGFGVLGSLKVNGL